ncbi:MAG: hypothetical protein KF893_07035 [Caldilineaceae bacterium]|nr:hypothetical protein [Caldilineaceae bacterium]
MGKVLVAIGLIAILLFGGWLVGEETVFSAGAASMPVTDRELIRNGDFALFSGSLIDGWQTRGGAVTNAQIEATADPQGGPAVKIFTNGADYATASAIYQEIHLPTTVSAAALSFNVRVVQSFDNEPPQAGELVNGWIAIVPVSGDNPPDTNNAIVAGGVYAENVDGLTGWELFSVALDQSGLSALNNARAANQRLVLMLGTVTNGFRLSLLVDNVSLKVSGSQTVPTFGGEIAYVDGKAVKRIDPNNGATQTVWTHPGDEAQISSVRWNPTATELGLISDHERFFSVLESDIYGIRADGSGLRRITNAPGQAAIVGGGYAKGSVRLTIFNNGSALETFSPFVISLRGAADLQSFALPPYQQTSQILIENVADLGGDQAIILIYSSPACGVNKRDVGGFVDVIPGQTVDVNVTFNATNCGGFVGAARDLSWKRDGTEIGYVLGNGPYKVESVGRATPGESWFGGSGLIDTVAWSPTDDRVLYDPIGSGGGIFVRDVNGGGPETQLINRTVLADPTRPAWLPDGGGFLYLFGGDIFSADAQGQNRQQLTFFAAGERAERVSPSPDGQFVVFERRLSSASTLWILERANPANMWPLTAGSKPDWSRVNPSAPVGPIHDERIFLPAVQR